MMQTPATIPSAPSSESFRDHKAALPFRSPGSANDSFDALMSHVMSSASQDRNVREFSDRRAAVAKLDLDKRNTIFTHRSQQLTLAQSVSRNDVNRIKSEDDATKEETSIPKSNRDDSDEATVPLVIIETAKIRDDSQIAVTQLITPPPAASPPALIPIVVGQNLPATIASTLKTEGGADGVEVSTNQTVTGIVSEAEEINRTKESNQLPGAKKINPTEAKVAETNTSIAAALNLKPAGDGADELAPQNISDGTTEKLMSAEISTASVSNDKIGAAAAFQTHGTPAAKLDMLMNKETNTNNVAGPAEQVLPGKDTPAISGKGPAAHGTMVMPFSSVAVTSDAAANSLITGQTVSATGSSDGPLITSNIIDLPARALERTHDMISLHGLRLLEIKSDSMQLVIKPGAGIQLSLELRQRGDGIEAQAILQQGDFNQMNEHWAELQQRLEQRGIRLAPLAGDENATAFGGNDQFQKQQQRPSREQDPLAAGAFAEFAMIAPPASAASQRGWQTWA